LYFFKLFFIFYYFFSFSLCSFRFVDTIIFLHLVPATLAQDALSECMTHKNMLSHDPYPTPHARYMLALLACRRGDLDTATHLLGKAKGASGYAFEPRLGFRINSLLQRMQRPNDAVLTVADLGGTARASAATTTRTAGVTPKPWRGGKTSFGLGLGVELERWRGEEDPYNDGEDDFFTPAEFVGELEDID
jgi:hypothetical protein